MPTGHPTRTLLFMIVVTTLPAAAALGPPDCLGDLPQVLNVGLPYRTGVDVADVQDRLERAARRLYQELALCPNRPLQVNGVLGTDYQLLDWLGREAIDVAVVSSLALHILQRDGVDLLELPALPDLQGGWLASEASELRSSNIGGADGRRLARPLPAADFDAFRDRLLERARGGADADSEKLPARMVFASHLSTPGFLVPIADTHRWLEPRLAATTPEGRRHAVRAAFWRQLLDHACFHLGVPVVTGPSCRELGPHTEAALEIEAVAIEPGEPPPGPSAPELRFGASQRDHLVVLRAQAEVVFDIRKLGSPLPPLPPDLAPLFGGPTPDPDELRTVPATFHSHLQPERYYGARPFAFTADESLRLLELQQRISAGRGLALVLPGGGVKAAYQSRLIDSLYATRLVNQGASMEVEASERLEVGYVIGTSGGALLGYFVARLRPDVPSELSRVLWLRPSPGGGEERPLDSADVFGWTDLPRYLSLLSIFLVFSLGLAACSLGPRSWLSPGRSSPSPLAEHSLRARLLLPMVAILAATPMLVRLASEKGPLAIEHVPEIEGLLYLVLLVFAMYADQCLVERPAAGARPTSAARAGWWALAVGVLLMSFPLLGRLVPELQAAFGERIRFGYAYFALGSVATLLSLVAIRRNRGQPIETRIIVLAATVFLGGTLVAVAALRAIQRWRPELLKRLDDIPLLFLALVATLLFVAIYRLAHGPGGAPAWYSWMEKRGGTLAKAAAVRWLALALGPPLGYLLILELTRPEASLNGDSSLRTVLFQPSKLDLPLGHLAICIGALLALFGIVTRLQRSSSRFRLEATGEFVDAALLVVVGLSLAVYATLWLASSILPEHVTLFELTPDFWLGLLAVTALFSAALLLWAYRARGGAATQRLHAALVFLCSRHPNAHLLSRRWGRMVLIAVAGLVWWNLLLAPGLYGNRSARKYLEGTDTRFTEALERHGPGAAPGLTATLLATANALETDGARFFLVVPGDQPCPVIRQPPGSGSTWHLFHAVAGTHHPAEGTDNDACRDLELGETKDREALRAFVFASGSPFPIFPAHWVSPDPKDSTGSEALVDGGYSNNTPVEAAARLGADRVLIVSSSHPLPAACNGRRSITGLTGPLVSNFLRLPGFLFERAQQLDRRSRANLFVVSLSPPPRCDWPLLSDFRRTTVRRMLASAENDLALRIGMVESWGPPRFQVSAQVGGWASRRSRRSD